MLRTPCEAFASRADAIPLEAWLESWEAVAASFVALPGDVSARRYYRGSRRAGGTVLLATYPPELLAAGRRFVATGRLLCGLGVRVPGIAAWDEAAGWMLLEDLGPRTVFDLAGEPWGLLEGLFAEAVGIADQIATLPIPAVAELSPPLDAALLARELGQTWEAYLAPEGWLAGEVVERAWRDLFEALPAELGRGPLVPCHRDFMVRNLVPLAADPAGRLAVLDHQDLRLGPRFYDLASLLNDSLFPPPEVAARLLGGAVANSRDAVHFHRVAAQRTLKAVGTFAAFARRGSPRHLPLIPPTLASAAGHLAHLPEAAPLLAELHRSGREPFC